MIAADRPSWRWTEETAELWDEGLAGFTDQEILAGARRFLTHESGQPNLAKLRAHCEADRPTADRSGPPGYGDRYTGPIVSAGALLWMRYWPDPVPEHLRDRHEAAFRAVGLEPYYPGGATRRSVHEFEVPF